MAKFVNGANGTFSGKVGSVIGSNWRNIPYMRGLSKKRTKPFTEAQLAQQEKFGLIARFILPLRGLFEIGFANVDTSAATLFNLALKENLIHAVTGSYPGFEINYPEVVLSKGSLLPARNVSLTAQPGEVIFNWNPVVHAFNGHADDVAYLLLYNPGQDLFYTTETAVGRATGQAEIMVGHDATGQSGEGWIFFTDRDGKKVSKTVYAGSVVFE